MKQSIWGNARFEFPAFPVHFVLRIDIWEGEKSGKLGRERPQSALQGDHNWVSHLPGQEECYPVFLTCSTWARSTSVKWGQPGARPRWGGPESRPRWGGPESRPGDWSQWHRSWDRGKGCFGPLQSLPDLFVLVVSTTKISEEGSQRPSHLGLLLSHRLCGSLAMMGLRSPTSGRRGHRAWHIAWPQYFPSFDLGVVD